MAVFGQFGAIPEIKGKSPAEAVILLRDEIIALREQLEYVLQNLSRENLNDDGFTAIKGMLTDDIRLQINGQEQELTSLSLTAAGLEVAVADAEGQISALNQTVDGLSFRVKDKSGTVSAVTLADGVLDLENLIFRVLAQNGGTVIDGGNITTGTVTAVNISGVNISGSEITGSTLISTSEGSTVKVQDGAVCLYDHTGTYLCGEFYYDNLGSAALNAGSGVALRISAGDKCFLDGKNGIEIGRKSGYSHNVTVGDGTGTIRLNGTVLVNGSPIE